MGEVEARNVSGGLGGIGGHALPENMKYKPSLPENTKIISLGRIDQRWSRLLESWNLVHQAVEP